MSQSAAFATPARRANPDAAAYDERPAAALTADFISRGKGKAQPSPVAPVAPTQPEPALAGSPDSPITAPMDSVAETRAADAADARPAVPMSLSATCGPIGPSIATSAINPVGDLIDDMQQELDLAPSVAEPQPAPEPGVDAISATVSEATPEPAREGLSDPAPEPVERVVVDTPAAARADSENEAEEILRRAARRMNERIHSKAAAERIDDDLLYDDPPKTTRPDEARAEPRVADTPDQDPADASPSGEAVWDEPAPRRWNFLSGPTWMDFAIYTGCYLVFLAAIVAFMEFGPKVVF